MYALYISPQHTPQHNLVSHLLIDNATQKLFELTDVQPDANYFTYINNNLAWVGSQAKQHLVLDFLSEKMLWRYHKINKSQEPILRALGWSAKRELRVLDLTAGLGRDSSMMGTAGIKVTMLERHPVLQILLEAALMQLKASEQEDAQNTTAEPKTRARKLSSCLSLIKTDAHAYLTGYLQAQQPPQQPPQQQEQLPQQQLAQQLAEPHSSQNPAPYDVIYMDPMFPHRKKSALVKLELRMIRELVGDDPDADELLPLALKTGVKRVVVKRPKGAAFIADLKPHHHVESPSMRFDVYQNI